MEVKIQQWGNSAAIRLPAALLKQMSVASGDVLKVISASADGLTMKPAKAKPHYRLSDLVAQCDLNAPEPADLDAWHNMQPVGRET
jgi:antitoxin ChpS